MSQKMVLSKWVSQKKRKRVFTRYFNLSCPNNFRFTGFISKTLRNLQT